MSSYLLHTTTFNLGILLRYSNLKAEAADSHRYCFHLPRRWGKWILFALTVMPSGAFAQHRRPLTVTDTLSIQWTPHHPINRITPQSALGAGIDGHDHGDMAIMLSPDHIAAMKSAGLKSLTYRLRTELGQEVWHWNPRGHWSEENKHQGYWISDSTSTVPIEVSYGYRLPRRGSTFDQANNDGYSRIDDGDDQTYWKSNPYLDEKITHEPDSLHPQWVAFDLGRNRRVNTIRIQWANPYATDFRIEYAAAGIVSKFNRTDVMDPYGPFKWKLLPRGVVKDCKGGNIVIRFSDQPMNLRVIRILCLKSSGSSESGSHDLRDSCGYAIREIQVGLTRHGHFQDWVIHGKTNKTQTPVFVSSTDLWHRASDIDFDTEQPGIDFVFQNDLNNHLPALLPLGVLYDIPENAMNLLHYLSRRNYPFQQVELGEEPDGQYISPTDFATLYAELAEKIHKEFPHIETGGLSFQGLSSPQDSSDEFTEQQWLGSFLRHLKRKNNTDLFQFFSYEWYPVDGVCSSGSRELLEAHEQLKEAMGSLFNQLLPHHFPVYITEYGYSVLGGVPEEMLSGALLNADIVGQFFELGGARAYLYGYEPGYLSNESGCSWGQLIMFGLGPQNQIAYQTATYHGAVLYAQRWAQPASEGLEIFPVLTSWHNREGQGWVKAYAIRRPDGKWSLMIINESNRYSVTAILRVRESPGSPPVPLKGPVEVYQFGHKQYEWIADRDRGHPRRSDPASKVFSQSVNPLDLPPFSITVLNQK